MRTDHLAFLNLAGFARNSWVCDLRALRAVFQTFTIATWGCPGVLMEIEGPDVFRGLYCGAAFSNGFQMIP